MTEDPVVVASYARTPMGGFQGALAGATAFANDGTVTPASATSISDGAAALVLTCASVVMRLGLTVVAIVRGHAAQAHTPVLFTMAPVPAIQKVPAKAGWPVADVNIFEINRAVAVVPMIAMRDPAIPHEKMNVDGGAMALGPPIGVSGARILVALLASLARRGVRRGVASLCIGGGEATAVAVELA
jgi:acetyl-CoA C-acetyltransferase